MNISANLYKVFFITVLLAFSSSELLAQKKKPVVNPLAKSEKEILAFEAKDKEKMPPDGSILFVGSSSVRFWSSLQKDMAPLRVLNRGFGGSTFPELRYYYERIVKPYKPKAIVVYEGDNDLVNPKMKPGMVLKNLKGFHERVQLDFPGTKVWFIAIKPSVARANLLGTVQKTNQMIQNYAAKTKTLEFLDVATPMLNKDGSIMSDIFIQDNLHMNPKGYAIWKSVIAPVLAKEYHQIETEY